MSSAPQRETPQAHSRTRIETLKPVWLFRDDVDRLEALLTKLGKAEISTDKALLSESSQIWTKLPVSWMCLSVPKTGLSVLVRPRQVEIRWSRDWNPAFSDESPIPQILEFVRSRRHILYFLGEKGWQLTVAIIALALLLLATAQYVRGASGDLLGIPGTALGVIVVVWVIAGTYVPSHTRVALFSITRAEFWRTVRHTALYLAGTSVASLAGLAIGLAIRSAGGVCIGLVGFAVGVAGTLTICLAFNRYLTEYASLIGLETTRSAGDDTGQ